MQWLQWLNKNEEMGVKYLTKLSKAEGMYKAKMLSIQDLVPKYMQDEDVIRSMKKSLRRAGFSVK
jgi:hypothetical protein